MASGNGRVWRDGNEWLWRVAMGGCGEWQWAVVSSGVDSNRVNRSLHTAAAVSRHLAPLSADGVTAGSD